MIFYTVVFAFLLALALSWLMVGVFRRRGPGPWGGLLFFLLLLFLITWAGGVWVTPVGPTVAEVPWLTFLAVALIVWLLLAAIIPPAPPQVMPSEPADEVTPEAVVAALTVGLFFYIVLAVLVVSIVAYYVLNAS